ncbi:cytochrome c-type biogenesis protein CcmH [Rickettsiales bacterium]|nr:cytochrome c-type biogenesis protein CcmH [Rickettsiales bacterium]
MNKKIILLLVLFPFFSNPGYSIEPDEVLKNKSLEDRARKISKELRCLVCQNEDIDNSNADIARDLRLLVRKKLLEGETNEQIISFIHSKYGDYVLYKPPIRIDTLFLWTFPFIMFSFFIYFFFRRKKKK